MGKSSTASFVVTRRIIVRDPSMERFLNKKTDLCNRLYNSAVRHYIPLVCALRRDLWYQKAQKEYRRAAEADDERGRREWGEEISLCMNAYGLTEYSVHEYMVAGKNISCPKGMHSDIVQKLGSSLYRSIRSAALRGTKIRYRKKGATNSFEEKKPDSGIIYNDADGTVKIMGRVFHLKPVRAKDLWMAEALTHRVKYCRVVRVPHGAGYRFFLQIVMEGTAPGKIRKGDARVGMDPGISTAAVTGDGGTGFFVLADGAEAYEAVIRRWARTYERRCRLANPDCYREDGRPVKGARLTNHTGGMLEAVMRLKSAYRKKSEFIRQSHGHLTNMILDGTGILIKEPMNFRALAKRAKATGERQSEASVVKRKGRRPVKVCKFKKRKRFGKSVQRRAPGLFIQILERKAAGYGITVVDVDIMKYRASQYDHASGEYHKPGLSERTKPVGGHRVQRDLYSSFILWNMKNPEEPDRERCRKYFRRFLKWQGATVTQILHTGDTTANFGLRDFIRRA